MDEQQEETDEVEEVQMQQQKEPGQHTIIIRPTAHGRSVIYENERGMGVERPAPKLAGNEEEQRHRKTVIDFVIALGYMLFWLLKKLKQHFSVIFLILYQTRNPRKPQCEMIRKNTKNSNNGYR